MSHDVPASDRLAERQLALGGEVSQEPRHGDGGEAVAQLDGFLPLVEDAVPDQLVRRPLGPLTEVAGVDAVAPSQELDVDDLGIDLDGVRDNPALADGLALLTPLVLVGEPGVVGIDGRSREPEGATPEGANLLLELLLRGLERRSPHVVEPARRVLDGAGGVVDGVPLRKASLLHHAHVQLVVDQREGQRHRSSELVEDERVVLTRGAVGVRLGAVLQPTEPRLRLARLALEEDDEAVGSVDRVTVDPEQPSPRILAARQQPCVVLVHRNLIRM